MGLVWLGSGHYISVHKHKDPQQNLWVNFIVTGYLIYFSYLLLFLVFLLFLAVRIVVPLLLLLLGIGV